MHEILIEEKILARNDEIASENRKALKGKGIYSINIVSAPGAGKTSLIERMAGELKTLGVKFAVVEGDLEGDFDSKRIERHGVSALQITTGRACHLDAHQISHALPWVFGQDGIELLVIENVGNMVCPAEYDLGEDIMVTVMSTTEGDDKPYKYPAMYRGVDALVINKIDLRPYVQFDMDYFKHGVETLNPGVLTFPVSCQTGEGLLSWYTWLRTVLG